MIVAERKPIGEILKIIAPYEHILLVGCGSCVTVCMAGGEKEVGVLASLLRIARKHEGRPLDVEEVTLERQCEPEFVLELQDLAPGKDKAILSMGCGAGVQTIAGVFPEIPVLPSLNTKFMGAVIEQGVWAEFCAGCGDCVLDRTGGVCPIARCSKSLLNGPCGGSQDGKCEIDPEIDCGWQLIYDRLNALGRLDMLEEILPPKDWSAYRDGGPRKVLRPDVRLGA